MIGPFLNAGGIVVGAMAGGFAGHRLPERVRHGLPSVFGLVAMGIGVALTVKAEHFSVIVLSLVLGTFLGEWADLQDRVHVLAHRAQGWLPRTAAGEASDEDIDRMAATFSSLIVLFCASSTGFVGALREGLGGDTTLLVAKAILDLFTALVFAVTVGYQVALLGLPVLLIEGGLVLGAHHVALHASPSLILDLSACGGLILVGTGFRILDIKPIRVINMLPSLVLLPLLAGLMARLLR